MQMLCIAAEAEPIGHVTVGGRPLDVRELARLTGEEAHVIESLLSELRAHAVFSETRKGLIYNRRMVRDGKIAVRNRENGSKNAAKSEENGEKTAFVTGQQNTEPIDDFSSGSVSSATQSPEAISQKEKIPDGISAKTPGQIARRMAEVWKAELGDVLAVPVKFTADRNRKCAARLRDSFGGDLEVWRIFCRRIKASAFLRGNNGRWRASFDWVLEPKHITKIEEGDYDDRPNGQRKSRSAESFESFMRTTADLATGRREGADCSRNGHAEGDLLV